jgi:hypothetical protein
MLWMDNNLTNDLIFRANGTFEQTTDTTHCISEMHYIVIGIYNRSGKHSREPSLGLVLFWFADLSVSLLPEVFENLIDAVDVTRRSLSADPIDYDRPLERIEITLRLGEDLVGSGR